MNRFPQEVLKMSVCLFLLILITFKVYKEGFERLAELLFAIIAVIFKGLWKVIALIIMIIVAIYNMWITFDKWVDKMIQKIE